MWYFKACPRCHGDLYVRQDSDGRYWASCLLCGQELAMKRRAKPLVSATAEPAPAGAGSAA